MNGRQYVRAVVAATALLASAAPLLAQATDSATAPPDKRYWSFFLLPLPTFNMVEGLGISVVGGWSFPSLPGPIPKGISITPVAHASWSGTRGIGLLVDAPGRWPGWRLLAQGMAERWQRMPYFGIGNASVYSDSLFERYGDEFYAYSLSRVGGVAAIQRDIFGRHLRLHLGAQYRRYDVRPLAGDTTLLGEEVAAGIPRDTGVFTGAEVRAGLILDTRDEEASPSRGLLLEAMAVRALPSVGDLDYRRYLLGAREYIPLSWEVSLTFRQTVELSEGRLPHYVAQERLTTWLPEDFFGSPTSLRVNLLGRWVGANTALASVDIRYKHWDYQITETAPIRLWLLLFADVARLWGEGEDFLFRRLHTGYGTGVRLQFSRGSIFGLDLGWNPDSGIGFTTAFSFGY